MCDLICDVFAVFEAAIGYK